MTDLDALALFFVLAALGVVLAYFLAGLWVGMTDPTAPEEIADRAFPAGDVVSRSAALVGLRLGRWIGGWL